jgi:superfamily II DNA or RNA helicase
MLSLRRYGLDAAYETVLRIGRLRKPQRRAFELVHALIKDLDRDLPLVPQKELQLKASEAGVRASAGAPELVFQLATGVGKTRLMGAIMAYLYRAGQTRNCVILAPRKTILAKFERESQTSSSKYLFLDPVLVPEPNLCFRSTLESFTPDPDRLNVFILSPQTITGSDRRFAQGDDFRSSTLEYLQGRNDLIVCIDESHHLGRQSDEDVAAWRQAVRQLEPRLQFGFTATVPRADAATVLYSYDLPECLRDGIYTKAVRMWVEPAPADISEDDWDKVALDFALQRLEAKRLAMKDYCERHPENPFIEPVLLVAARDTEHADSVGAWLRDRRGLAQDEIQIAHSHRTPSEAELEQLVAIDRPGNRIRVVVNVFQLSEGWDVTNVYVVAPLRAMATFQNAVQTMGRGLRLPFGTRVGEPEVDTLDVLCFGKESFERIVELATAEFGKAADGSAALAIEGTQGALDLPVETRPITIAVQKHVTFEVPKVRRVPPEPVLDFEVGSIRELTRYVAGLDLVSLDRSSAEDEALRYDFRSVVRVATLRVLSELPYLSAAAHTNQVEGLIRRLLEGLGADERADVSVDPMKVAALMVEEIDRRYKSQPVKFLVDEGIVQIEPHEFEWPLRVDLEGPIDKQSLAEWQ